MTSNVIKILLPWLVAVLFGTMLVLPNNDCLGQLQQLEVREGAGVPQDVRRIYNRGCRFLQSIQQTNGSFGSGSGMHGTERPGICSLCVLALLSTGEDPNFGVYSANIRRGLRFIIRSQNTKTGYIPGNMYGHGFAMLALAEAYGVVDDDLLWVGHQGKKRSIAEALELAVRLALTAQKRNPLKGWRYSPQDRSADTSVVGAVLMGLLAARNAGIAVPDESIEGALKYMKSMTSSKNGDVGYSGLGGFGDSAARSSIACLVFAIAKRKEWKEFEATKNYLTQQLVQGPGSSWPYYSRYYRAQALFQADYVSWAKWNTVLIAQLEKGQNSDGHIADSGGRSGHGKAYSTAMSLLALALNYRFLPIYER